MSRVLIGVDAGTSNLKAAAFDLDGDQVEIATIENPVETPQSGWQEQNMTTNWKKTATVISEVVEDLGDDHEILGIGITGQGDGCWLIDDEGDPVGDAGDRLGLERLRLRWRIGDEADRPKRRRALTEAGGSMSECSRCEMIVGTTENHVACDCSAQSQKRLAENREHSAREPTDTSDPMTDTHSPLIW